MTSVVGGVRDRLLGLASKLLEARGRCERNGEIDRELGRLKSAISGVQGRCRDQKAAAAQLVRGSRVAVHQLPEKLAVAEERAGDLAVEFDYCRSLLQEVQMAVYVAEDAARKSAAEL